MFSPGPTEPFVVKDAAVIEYGISAAEAYWE